MFVVTFIFILILDHVHYPTNITHAHKHTHTYIFPAWISLYLYIRSHRPKPCLIRAFLFIFFTLVVPTFTICFLFFPFFICVFIYFISGRINIYDSGQHNLLLRIKNCSLCNSCEPTYNISEYLSSYNGC